MKYHATAKGESFIVERTPEGVRVGDREIRFDAEMIGQADVLFRMPDRSARVRGDRTREGWRIRIGGHEWTVALETERARAIRELTGHDGPVGTPDLHAPMPGLVVKVLVEEGATVEPGDGLIVVEAMKMENELKAGAPGVVRRIAVAAGETVDRDQLLVEFEAAEP